ncbi:MAG TPA: hypothetical protein VN973_07410 [Candidatus Dormibacteraeota bacterium]|nr:hypothetical protein [Candidatus Dormibacteraeota bacterium]
MRLALEEGRNLAGAVLAPWLAAVGAIAAMVTDRSIVVERVQPAEYIDGAAIPHTYIYMSGL